MADKPYVAIVDDEADMRNSIAQWMSLSGYQAEAFDTGEALLKRVKSDYPGVVISDIRMPNMDGMALLRRLQSMDASLPVILITGHGDVTLAVEAMQIGAYDFIEKPFDPERLAELAKRAVTARRLTLDNRNLRKELSDGTMLLRKLAGSSQIIEKLRENILDIAQADGHVLVSGETGTGKSLIAHALHACGPRKGKAFVHVNCSAMGAEALEAHLFGPCENSGDQPALETADGGTLCLENIEDLPDGLQARLVAELNQEEAPDINSAPRDLHIISVSSNVIAGETAPDCLRQDLYFRLVGLNITTPPLRNRGEDILMLFNRFCARFAEDYGCDAPEVSAEDAARLIQSRWPGNIRQLMNVAERAVLQIRRGEDNIASLLSGEESSPIPPEVSIEKPLREHVEAFEKMLIDNSLRRNRGAVSSVMEELALPRRTLNEKMAKYGLIRAEYL